jgi:molybdate transport system substrate-binding protein
MRDDATQRVRRVLAWLAATACLAAATPAAAQGDEVLPPWQHGANNDALDKGVDFTVPGIDALADFHGDVMNPALVLYVGGNYYFAMAPLVAAFEQGKPEYRGHIFYETIPPGLLVKQMEAGGTITSGNMTWTAKPDVYLAGLKRVKELVASGVLEGPAVIYATNTLTIMVPKDNPAHVTGLADLARPDIRLAMPNPAFEGVARQIEAALRKTGGENLFKAVYETKVRDGTTVLTRIHHRQTPLLLMQRRADAGVTWKSEAIFQEQVHNPITHIDIPESVNATGIYAGAAVKGAAHPAAAQAWLSFIRSPQALHIFERYGFKAYEGNEAGSAQ